MTKLTSKNQPTPEVETANRILQPPFITFEGPDGAGKTTILNEIKPWLDQRTHHLLTITREPGGDDISEQIRQVILDSKNDAMNTHTELLLYEAARSQLVSQIIKPALAKQHLVVCDRYVDSTTAYQGGGNQTSISEIDQLNRFATNQLMPILTIYFRVPAEFGLKRIARYRKDKQDRLDKRKLDYHNQVVKTYDYLVEQHPDRIKVVNGEQSIENRVNQTKDLIEQVLKQYPQFN